MPRIAEIVDSRHLQEALLNHPFPNDVLDYLRATPADEYVGLLHVVLVAGYVLNRVAVTVVRGRIEDYAFTVFESLNTTGEPLTRSRRSSPEWSVQKDFRPMSDRRPMSICLRCRIISRVSSQAILYKTRLAICFCILQTRRRATNCRSDLRIKRKYMKEEFERHEADSDSRVRFIRHLRDTTLFVQHAWSPKTGPPNLHLLPVACSTD